MLIFPNLSQDMAKVVLQGISLKNVYVRLLALVRPDHPIGETMTTGRRSLCRHVSKERADSGVGFYLL